MNKVDVYYFASLKRKPRPERTERGQYAVEQKVIECLRGHGHSISGTGVALGLMRSYSMGDRLLGSETLPLAACWTGMGQDHDSVHVGLDRLIELAELARQASPDERMRLIRAFRQVAEALQEVIRVREEMRRHRE